jgi:ribosomal-protein-alanine N-acetyltransferase
LASTKKSSAGTDSKSIIGKCVYLRAPQEEDCLELVALNQLSVKFHRGLVSPPRTRVEFEALLNRSRRVDTEYFLICRREDSAIVGNMNLSQIFREGFKNAYLGYYVGAPFANQGYATESIKLLLRHVFRKMKLHRIEANIQPGNIASIALVRQAGFTQEGYSRRYLKIDGRWRDHERWALTVEDWKASKVI